jgi:hypothetical protein
MQYRFTSLCSTLLSESPGIWISIVFPETKMSGSPTPNESTRFRMFSSACCIVPGSVPSGAERITARPPSRSRPRTGLNTPKANESDDATTRIATKITEIHSPRLRFTPAPVR